MASSWRTCTTYSSTPPTRVRALARRIARMKERYRNYLYLEVMPEESKNVTFYERQGFTLMQDGVAMQICNLSDKR